MESDLVDNGNDADLQGNLLENDQKEWILIIENNEEWQQLLNKRRNAEMNLKVLREEKNSLDNDCLKIEEKINLIQLNLNKIKSELDYL